MNDDQMGGSILGSSSMPSEGAVFAQGPGWAPIPLNRATPAGTQVKARIPFLIKLGQVFCGGVK
ncbi:MAG TPA: hypothetical protein VFJ85_03175 [Acidimicrobiales bacterium]|nr:hypothetical protein [Acidimicrobiales bacterium]